MAGNIHNGPNGPGPCGASGNGRGCPFDPEGTGENHFSSREEAQAAFDTKMESEHGLVATASKAPAETEDEINARINEETYGHLRDLRGEEREKANAEAKAGIEQERQEALAELYASNGYEGEPEDGGTEEYKAGLKELNRAYRNANNVLLKHATYETEDEINARINEETYSPLKDLRGNERWKTNAAYRAALKEDYQTGLHEVRLENGYEDGVPADGGSEQYKADLATHSKVYKDAKEVFLKYANYETEEEKNAHSNKDPYEYLKKLDSEDRAKEIADFKESIEDSYLYDLHEIQVENGYENGVPPDGGSEQYKTDVAARNKAYDDERDALQKAVSSLPEEDQDPPCTCRRSDCYDCAGYSG